MDIVYREVGKIVFGGEKDLWTGYKDQKGGGIFENDLISYKGQLFKIEWDDFDLCFKLKSWYRATKQWDNAFLINRKYCKEFDIKFKDIASIDLYDLIKIDKYDKGNKIMDCLIIGKSSQYKEGSLEQWIEVVLYKGE